MNVISFIVLFIDNDKRVNAIIEEKNGRNIKHIED